MMGASEGGGGLAEGAADPIEQFHPNEAISAVAEVGFLGEEDDDYEDLYNDVNVGENFLQSLGKSEDIGFKNEEVDDKLPHNATPVETLSAMAEKEQEGGAMESDKFQDYPTMGSRADKFQDYPTTGSRASEMGAKSSTLPSGGSGTLGGEQRVELGHSSGKVAHEGEHASIGDSQNECIALQTHTAPVENVGNVVNAGNHNMARQVGNMTGNEGVIGAGGGGGSIGGTLLFVGDLHWWTTDAELEAELSKYGPVKEVKYFDEKASGKSKGYCQVDFFDPAVATACKEGMNGHIFNGRPCVVAYASPYTVRKMGESQINKNQQTAQTSVSQARRGPGDVMVKPGGNNIVPGGNHQGIQDTNRVYGRGNWGGRGVNHGMGNRAPLGSMRNRPGGMGGRCSMLNGGGAFGQGVGGTPPLLHPHTMIGPGFDPAFGGSMGRMGSFGGFAGPLNPYSGITPSFPPVGNVGLPGIAPHVNPAFFGRGMPMSMGMMPGTSEGPPNMGMWSDMNMGGWAGEEHGSRAAGESSYTDEAVSDPQPGEARHDRGTWHAGLKEKDIGGEQHWSGASDRRYRDEKEPRLDREMPLEKDIAHDHDWSPERKHRDSRELGRVREPDRSKERGRGRDGDRDHGHDREYRRDAVHHRHRDPEPEYNDDWGRGRSSRTHAKSRLSHEEDKRSRSRDTEYGKRRRMASE